MTRPAPSFHHGSSHRRTLICTALSLALAGLTVFVFQHALQCDYILLDDPDYILNNPNVLGGLTWAGVKWAFTSTYASNWHPLAWLSHMLDIEMFGVAPRGAHLVNIALHALSAVLLFWFCLRCGLPTWASFFISGFFSAHPLRLESVVWIAERKDVLSVFFWLLCLHMWMNYTRKPGRLRYAAVLVTLALGLLSKPMVVTLPFVLVLVDYWPLERFSGRRSELIHQAREKSVLLLFSILTCLATLQAQHQAVRLVAEHGFFQRVCNAFASVARYMGALFWPSDLAIFYPSLQDGALYQAGALGIALVVGVSVLAFLLRRRAPGVIVGWLWFLLTLIPVSGVVQVGAQSMADRYTYIPSIGFLLAFFCGAHAFVGTGAKRKLVVAVAGVVVLAASCAATYSGVQHWKTTRTLFEHAAEAVPSHVAYSVLGFTYFEEGDFSSAVELYEKALAFEPRDITPYQNLGLAYFSLGELNKAEYYFSELRRRRPDVKPLLLALSKIAFLKKDYTRVVELLAPERAFLSENPEASIALSAAYLELGRHEDALTRLAPVLEIKPPIYEAFELKGLIEWEMLRSE